MHNDFTSLGQAMGGFVLPLGIFERSGGKRTEEEATWTCTICGEITPRLVSFRDDRKIEQGYVPEKCLCQRIEDDNKQRLQTWKDQEEVKQKRIAKCFNWLGETRPREWQVMTLETFQHEGDMHLHAYMKALDFIERPHNLILWSSGYGSGKTHLATAICNFMQQERGWKCLFAACQDLFREIEARWDKPEDYQDTYSDLVKHACSCDLLVLDDMARVGKYRKELDEIVDRRHNQGKPTIITLNADKVEIDEKKNEITGVSLYIGRAASDRLCDESLGGLTICQMNGPSWRRRKLNATM